MLDPSVGVYRVHGKALKDGIVGWVTVAGNQGTLGWHVSYRAGWLANLWAIGFQRCFWCIMCVYMIYDIHVYIHSWNIPTGKNKNTHTHTPLHCSKIMKTHNCCHSNFKFESTTAWDPPFNVWPGAANHHIRVCVSKKVRKIEQFFGWYELLSHDKIEEYIYTWNLMAIHLEMVVFQLDDFHQISTYKKWLEITISIQLKTGKLWGFQV